MKEKHKLILSCIALPLVWIASVKLFFLLPLSFPPEYKWFVSGTVGTLMALLVTRVFSKLFKVSFSEIGLQRDSKTPKRMLVGLLIGGGIACVMLFAIVSLTELEVSRYEGSSVPTALFWMLSIIPLAYMEEVAFRGFSFFKLEKIIGLRLTIIITSVLFAYYHDVTGASFTSQLLGPGVWGIIYGLSAIWSKGIAVPTGIHVGANIVLASLGQKDADRAIWAIDYSSEVTESIQSHTEMLGLVCQLLLLFLGVFMTEWYIRKRGRLKSSVDSMT